MKQTLEGFEQVENVEFVSDKDQFEITYRNTVPMGDEFREAVTKIIIFPGVRKFLGQVGAELNNSYNKGP